MILTWTDYLSVAATTLQAAIAQVDNGFAITKCLRELDEKVGNLSIEDRVLVTEQLNSEAKLLIGSCSDMVFRDLYQVTERFSDEVVKGVVGTEAQKPRLQDCLR